MANVDALVGKSVKITMMDDAKHEGVVFSFVPERDLLVILRNVQDAKASIHIVRLPFVKDIESVSGAGATTLPPGLSGQLPTLQTTNAPLQKSIAKLVKENSDKKNLHLKNLDGAPSGAVECYLKLAKVSDLANWDPHNKAIVYGDFVTVTSEDNWKTYDVTPVSVGNEDQAGIKSQVDRVKGYLGMK